MNLSQIKFEDTPSRWNPRTQAKIRVRIKAPPEFPAIKISDIQDQLSWKELSGTLDTQDLESHPEISVTPLREGPRKPGEFISELVLNTLEQTAKFVELAEATEKASELQLFSFGRKYTFELTAKFVIP